MASTRSAHTIAAAARTRRRGSLTRDEILAAGLRIARRDDLRRLTMQRLGDELGVTAMAIYRHFHSKSELLDAMLDRFVREAAVTDHGTDPRDWRLWIRRTAAAQYRALADTPGILPFVASSQSWRFGPAAAAVFEAAQGVLRGAGFRRRDAIEIHGTVLALAVGWATLESGGGLAGQPAGPLVAEPAALSSAALFERGLDRYLGALEPAPVGG